MKVIYDKSWTGCGGIGRFSDEVYTRITSHRQFSSNRNPASPLNSVILSFISFNAKDYLFLPGYIPPLFFVGRYFFVIHDLNHIERIENSSLLKRLFYRCIVRRGCKKSYKILTVSEYSRSRIIKWSGVQPDKVVNVGNGVDTAFHPDVAPCDLGGRYFLCVGNRKLHKNEHRLVEAFSKSKASNDTRLVFTGAPDEALTQKIKECAIADKIIFLGNVSNINLPSLYRGAVSLLFPSLYEGFGLPVIEAMACGVPVMTSNSTSLPEVAGDAALIVDPLDISAMSLAITRLYLDEELRNYLSTKGIERAKGFNWDNTASRIQCVIDEAIKGETSQ